MGDDWSHSRAAKYNICMLLSCSYESQEHSGFFLVCVNASGLQWELVGSGRWFYTIALTLVLKELRIAFNIRPTAGSYQKIHMALEF